MSPDAVEALKRLVYAMDAMEESNRTWNPFNKKFVRPWTELYAAHESARNVLKRLADGREKEKKA